MNPYVQYMYSYPHKTAYRRLRGISLEQYVHYLKGGGNGRVSDFKRLAKERLCQAARKPQGAKSRIPVADNERDGAFGLSGTDADIGRSACSNENMESMKNTGVLNKYEDGNEMD